jgi:hypothetical protein
MSGKSVFDMANNINILKKSFGLKSLSVFKKYIEEKEEEK